MTGKWGKALGKAYCQTHTEPTRLGEAIWSLEATYFLEKSAGTSDEAHKEPRAVMCIPVAKRRRAATFLAWRSSMSPPINVVLVGTASS